MLDWCARNQHDICRREVERFHFDPKGKIVMTGEFIKCQCKKRGCLCYTAPGDRVKTTKRRRAKK